MGTLRKIINQNKGSAVVEVAILIPLMIFLIFGFLFFINAARENIIIQTAAREGAREYAISDNAANAIQKTVNELALGNIDANHSSVTITPFSDSVVRADDSRGIRIEKKAGFYVPFGGEYLFTLRGESVFHREYDTSFYD